MRTRWLVPFWLIFLFLSGVLCAHGMAMDSLKNVAPDSLRKPIAADTLNRAAVPVTIDQWEPQSALFATGGDSLLQPVYRFGHLLYLNYTGLADVFRLQPAVQVYDFLEMGLPRYVAPLHRWPQQNKVFFEGLSINDPLNGMFNTRLLFPDALQAVCLGREGLSVRTARPTTGHGDMTLIPRVLNPEKPYTRLMYREGDFGYSDLDITFARRLGRKTVVQLGGINRDYDPNQYRGTHYRGRLTFIPAAHLLAVLTYRKSSENVTFFDRSNRYGGPYRRNEIWQWYAAELRHVDGQFKDDWRLGVLFNADQRKYRFIDSGVRFRLNYDRLLLHGRKVGRHGALTYQIAGQAQQVKAHGTVYDRAYTDSRFKLHSAVGLQLPDSLYFTIGSSGCYQWDQAFQFEPYVRLVWQRKKWALRGQIEHTARFPTLHERYFNYRQISGDRNLPVEQHENLSISADFIPASWNRSELTFTMHSVRNEILFNGTAFLRGGARRFAFVQARSVTRFYKFELHAGGQTGLAGQLLGPNYSAYAQLRYHDRWIHGHLIVDAIGTVRYFGPFKNIAFQPYAERFYRLPGQDGGFFLLSYKIVGTVKDARLFMEMDNPLGWQYRFIDGYSEIYRRVRFGVSWVLWN